MKENLMKIINNYGIMEQLKYIHSEYFELDEAILKFENTKSYFTNHNWYKECIAEEIADIMVMLKQFQYYYGINDEEIEEIMNFKIDRQLDRIKEEGK